MWKKIRTETIFEHPRLTLAEDIVELPDGSQVPYLKHASPHDSVTVVCIRGQEVLLQREYSYPPNEVLYQFPGGKVEKDESHDEAAARELVEEAGLQDDSLRFVGAYYPDNRRSHAKMHVFLAVNPQDVEKKGGDNEEDISSHWVRRDKLDIMIQRGEITNGSLLATWSLCRNQAS